LYSLVYHCRPSSPVHVAKVRPGLAASSAFRGFHMAPQRSQRQPRPTLRWVLMLVGVIVVFGGVFAFKAFFAKQTNDFFDNMPQPAVAVTSYTVDTARWADSGEAVGTFVAVNGTDVTTEAGGVVRSIEFDAGQRVGQG